MTFLDIMQLMYSELSEVWR